MYVVHVSTWKPWQWWYFSLFSIWLICICVCVSLFVCLFVRPNKNLVHNFIPKRPKKNIKFPHINDLLVDSSPRTLVAVFGYAIVCQSRINPESNRKLFRCGQLLGAMLRLKKKICFNEPLRICRIISDKQKMSKMIMGICNCICVSHLLWFDMWGCLRAYQPPIFQRFGCWGQFAVAPELQWYKICNLVQISKHWLSENCKEMARLCSLHQHWQIATNRSNKTTKDANM